MNIALIIQITVPEAQLEAVYSALETLQSSLPEEAKYDEVVETEYV